VHFSFQHFITYTENAVEFNVLDKMSIELDVTTNFAFGEHIFVFMAACYAMHNALLCKNGKEGRLKTKVESSLYRSGNSWKILFRDDFNVGHHGL
jgi:hypothetical protein